MLGFCCAHAPSSGGRRWRRRAAARPARADPSRRRRPSRIAEPTETAKPPELMKAHGTHSERTVHARSPARAHTHPYIHTQTHKPTLPYTQRHAQTYESYVTHAHVRVRTRRPMDTTTLMLRRAQLHTGACRILRSPNTCPNNAHAGAQAQTQSHQRRRPHASTFPTHAEP